MKRNLLSILSIFIMGFCASVSHAQTIEVSDDGSGTGTTTWTSDNTYLLDGFVFVNSGQTLTIEAGTVIKGKPGTGADAAALIVANGGTIMANGTEADPIIMTFENDPLDGSVPYTTNGEWGGLIVLGDAQLNSSPGETQIEGIPETEPRGLYGGNNDTHSSGSITYVSIRHGGTDIGAGNEINGLTLGGVGSGTTIEHVEVISNQDDGIEFFGGTAEVKWAIVAFCGDDSFDYDEGWRGKGQFWCTIQDPNGEGNGDRGGEHDGGTDPEDGTPYAHPVIYNTTYIGRGIDAGKRALTFRDNAAGEYHNSIFANWGKGIDVENLASGEDSYNRLSSGELAFAGNCFYNVSQDGTAATATDLFKITMGAGGWMNDADSLAQLSASEMVLQATFDANGNEVADPGLTYSTIQPGSMALDLVPANDVSGATPPTDAFYTAATYKGAFEPNETNENWLLGWSYVDQLGFLEAVTGIDEMDIASVTIYPNPSSSWINIDVEDNMIGGQVFLYNQLGSLVATEAIRRSNVQIDIKDLANGIYLITALNGDQIVTQQIIKE